MVALHYFKKGRKEVIPLFFHHGTQTSEDAKNFLISQNIENLQIGSLNSNIPKGKSLEEYWRDERYKFLNQFNDAPVITCHHLDDQVETWIYRSFWGEGALIPYRNKNIIRPFLLTKKIEIEAYATRHNIAFSQDNSNFDTDYMRNRIRHNVIKEALIISPGIYKIIRDKVRKNFSEGVDK
jgi:tRNA(Ile)-lysidine synthetase-like protein